MRKEVVLITGANGEIGHGLISHLAEKEKVNILALDVMPMDDDLRSKCERFIQGDILDHMLLGRLVAEYEIRTIYHLASILSTKAEYNPETAHRVNVEGTLNLLRLAVEQATWQGKPVKFLYPSSIAVYGLPDCATKNASGKISEEMWCQPTTMYGCNKLYCEQLGRYYTKYYRQLAADKNPSGIDFRAIKLREVRLRMPDLEWHKILGEAAQTSSHTFFKEYNQIAGSKISAIFSSSFSVFFNFAGYN